MRKILLLLSVTLLLPIAAGAQSQRILGHYDSDVVGTEGVALTSTTGKVSIGTILEAEELDIFNGGKIVSIRVGLAESTPVSKVFVVPIAAGGAYGAMVSWPAT